MAANVKMLQNRAVRPRASCGIIQPDLPTQSLQTRFEEIKKKIGHAAERSGRAAADIRLVAVTKRVSPDLINQVIGWGVREVAESRIQEAEAKRPSVVQADLRHHFIGQLQTNKARRAVELFDLIQSVDRPGLAQTLDRIASEAGRRVRCLVEVKVSTEATKSGVPVANVDGFLQGFKNHPWLSVEGLMTIAPLGVGEEETRRCFRQVAQLFRARYDLFGEAPVLSMGMSDDFELAIEEGATMVRLGRALFGERM